MNTISLSQRLRVYFAARSHNLSRAAREIGVTRNTLYRMMRTDNGNHHTSVVRAVTEWLDRAEQHSNGDVGK